MDRQVQCRIYLRPPPPRPPPNQIPSPNCVETQFERPTAPWKRTVMDFNYPAPPLFAARITVSANLVSESCLKQVHLIKK